MSNSEEIDLDTAAPAPPVNEFAPPEQARGGGDGESAPKMTPAQQRLFELRMKLNQARSANHKEVVEEDRRSKAPEKSNKQRARDSWQKRQDAKEGGGDKEKDRMMNITAMEAEAKDEAIKKKEKRKAAFGWDIFNSDTLYRAYKKRATKLDEAAANGLTSASTTTDDPLAYGQNSQVDDANVDFMVQELDEKAKRQAEYSRRRAQIEDADITYISERNRVYNKKITRAFDSYTLEIKQNLERGTAL